MNRAENDTFLRALLRQPTDYTPVWLMRQAGRYLPEYGKTRERAGSFLQLCKSPSFCCEAALQPLARFPLDAAIVFSDILTLPEAMGLDLHFSENEGPRFERPLREEGNIRALVVPDPYERLRYVMDAVAETRRALAGSVPLVGFAGSPFTLACYMVEGGASGEFTHLKTMLYDRPDLAHRILSINAQAVTACLNAQIESGAQVVMLFDSWGGCLTEAAYREFSLSYVREVVAGLIREKDGRRVPSIVFTRGGGLWLEAIAACGCDALGLDWTIDIGAARQRVGARVALQGNLDPAVLLASPEAIVREARAVLDGFGAPGIGHVFNLGHGVSRFTPPEHVAVLVDAVHEHSRRPRGESPEYLVKNIFES
jgi:uroporphyrinogen decarboxylase